MSQPADLFLHFVEPHFARLHAVARNYGRREVDARDLVQESLLRAWRNFSRVDAHTHRPAWLFVILRNVAIDWGRSAAARLRDVPMPVAELTDLMAPDPGDPLAAFPALQEREFCELLDQRLAQAVQNLEGPYREVLVLSVVAELTYREIAEALGCPLGTVMSRMGRARRALLDARSKLAEVRAAVVQADQERKTQASLVAHAKAQLDAAQEAVRLAVAGLEAGTLTTLEVLHDESAAAEARLRHATAVVRHNQAQIVLVAALGILSGELLTASP